ncbi:formate dehydrogenase accessory sulfurtransferase FdhD [soil metagenome]
MTGNRGRQSKRARAGSKTRVKVTQVEAGDARLRSDQLATEEPLEIRLSAAGETRSVAVTMRTPGSDFELAAGFLYGEGILSGRDAVAGMSYCVDAEVAQHYNTVNVALRAARLPELRALERHFYTSSACGVCGKTSLEALRLRDWPAVAGGLTVSHELITALPAKLREAQGIFELTGGLHAAALFDAGGELRAVREDVGRHNALDKLIGWALLEGRLPLAEHLVMLSGRASFELLQKSLAAGVPVVCAVSAPSSLAVAVAGAFGITLIGFLRGERFNIYSGEERIAFPRGEGGQKALGGAGSRG